MFKIKKMRNKRVCEPKQTATKSNMLNVKLHTSFQMAISTIMSSNAAIEK